MQSVWKNKDRTASVIENLKKTNNLSVRKVEVENNKEVKDVKVVKDVKKMSLNKKPLRSDDVGKATLKNKQTTQNKRERDEWRAKYNPKTLKLGMVLPR